MKPHRFKGSGPGFPCHYRAGSEVGVRQCGRMVDDDIHAVGEDVLEKLSEDARQAFGRAVDAFRIPRCEQEQFWPGSAMSVWQGHSDVVLALLKKKSESYGNAWVEQGYMGNLARVLSKTSRLKNLLWRDGSDMDQHKDPESVLDTLYDLSALCAFAIANIEEGNRWGHG